MRAKEFTLLSDNDGIDDERWFWNIRLIVRRDGVISNTNYIKARQMRAYYLRNQEKLKQQSRDWTRANPGRGAETCAKWREDNPDAYRRISRQNAKRQKARRREMGFEPLNDKFEGAHAHHINNDQVIYIPAEMHKNNHNLRTGVGMAEMNALAFQYLFKHT